MNSYELNEMNSKPLDFSGLISMQIQLVEKAQNVLLETSRLEANRQMTEYYTHDITLRLEQLRFLINLQDSEKRHFSPDHVSCDSENMGEGYGFRVRKNYD